MVNNRQCSGSSPSGGLTSRTSTSRSRTVAGRPRSISPRGRRIATAPYRISTVAVRLGCPIWRAGSSLSRRPTTGKPSAAANSKPPPLSKRFDIARVSKCTGVSDTAPHAG